MSILSHSGLPLTTASPVDLDAVSEWTPPDGSDLSSVQALISMGYQPVGQIQPRRSKEIEASSWSIGCETLDRDYVDFNAIRDHLGDLGAKAIRLQAGWAKCEPAAGQPYRWDWLDEIIAVCSDEKIAPWLQCSYGNPAYPGGGGIGLAESIPKSATALKAWDSWVNQMVLRYSDRVDTWEVWNEPDSRNLLSPEDYAAFYMRTARIIRSVQPKSKIIGGAVARHDESNYSGRFLQTLQRAGEIQLLDELSYHFYPHNPDDCFELVEDLSRLCDEYAPHVNLRQGETGSPSESLPFLALGQYEWNERKQAVWNLRRLLAHHARGIPMNLFQIADMLYEQKAGALFKGRNSKGLLKINQDKTVACRKPSYYAAQQVFSLLDSRFPLVPLEAYPPLNRSGGVSSYYWQAMEQSNHVDPQLLCWWNSDTLPEMTVPTEPSFISFPTVEMENPVLIDFLTGTLFSIPPQLFSENNTMRVPLLDCPLAISAHHWLRT